MPKSPKKQTYKFGIIAEKIAIIFLRLKGYKILKWRYRNHFGEIDIIAKKSQKIIFIEVKARKNKTNIEEILKPKQLTRIKRSAQFFIAKNPQFHNCDLRFDFIEIGKFFLPKHQRNYWYYW